MPSQNEIYATILSRVHRLLETGDTTEANRILAQLRKKNVQSRDLEALEAMSLIKNVAKTNETLEHEPHVAKNWIRHFESNWALKREREAVETLLQGLQHHPREIEFHRRLISQYCAAGAFERAFAHCNEALSIDPKTSDLLDRRAHIAVKIDHSGADKCIEQMVQHSPENWLQAYNYFIQLGQPTDAEAVLQKAIHRDPEDIQCQIALARMALWRGDVQSASKLATQCIEAGKNQAEGYALKGMALAYLNDPTAHHFLKQAYEVGLPQNSPIEKSEMLCWLAIAEMEKEQWTESIRWCDLAISSSKTGQPIAYLIRIIATNHGINSPHKGVNTRWFSYIEEFAPLTGDLESDAWKKTYQAFYAEYMNIRSKLCGNLSPTPTWMENGSLRGMTLGALQHHRLRFSQQRIRVQNTTDLWDAFESLMKERPEDPECYTYSGEVLLWVGRYEEAEALFRQALDRSYITIWTWIGLGAALGYQNRHDEALQAFLDGIEETRFEGPTLFVYRGEFLRRNGDIQQARKDLDTAVQQKPQRLSAWINRVLVDHALGIPEPARTLSAAIRRYCTSLWWDACAQAGTNPMSLDEQHAALEAMLDMMFGNRSSTILTYQSPGVPLRGIKWIADYVPPSLTERYSAKH